jgi:tRNA threonylcarbamoyladenosine biosynthesis protein TsaB
MRILAFDCAGAQCAVAVRVGPEIVAERHIRSERGHAQLLMPLLRDIAAEAGLRFADFDRFAVTIGPGSFTGIRVALAAARGLALGTDKPVIGIDVFSVVASETLQAGIPAPRLLVAVESRRAECFLQLFDVSGEPIGSPTMLAPDTVADWIGPGPIAVAGDAAGRVTASLPEAVDLSVRCSAPSPGTLARLAADRPIGDPPRPFYLRAPDAIPTAARAARSRPTGVPLTPAMGEVAAALHATSGLPESWSADAFGELLAVPGTEGCIATDGNTDEPIGFALWRVAAEEAELLTIAVSPKRRRQGIGRFLLNQLLATAASKGARRMVLEVAVDNHPAKALYRALGFAPCGRRPGYYRTRSGAVDAEILALDNLAATELRPIAERTA